LGVFGSLTIQSKKAFIFTSDLPRRLSLSDF